MPTRSRPSTSPTSTSVPSSDHQVQGITYLLRASDHQIHHLASHLALYLERRPGRTTCRSPFVVLCRRQRQSGAVWSSMGENSDRFRWSCFLFLREFLIIWKNAVPQAHVRKLHAVIAGFDQGLAQRCFPSFPITSPDAEHSPRSFADCRDGRFRNGGGTAETSTCYSVF